MKGSIDSKLGQCAVILDKDVLHLIPSKSGLVSVISLYSKPWKS